MALDAVIFDVDGTLIDSNPLHVEAWRHAFAEHGYRVELDRIAVEVGKGGDQLVPAILGRGAAERLGERLGEAQRERFVKLATANPPRVFDGAIALLREVRRRGMKVVVATSSGQKVIDLIRTACGLDLAAESDAMVTADDAERSKPAPDLVATAVARVKRSPAQCAMVGDTPYDATAARRAGVVCLGVRTGGFTEEQLVRAGARSTYTGVGAILSNLDAALAIASPGDARWSQSRLEELMERALDVARQGMEAGEAPIGCVLARGDGTVFATGFNRMNATQNKIAHAETVTFANAAGKVPLDARDLVLVSTLEPCVMCTGAAMVAAVDTIVYAMRAPADSGSERVVPPRSAESQMPRLVGDVLADRSRALFEEFLTRAPGEDQRRYVRQLLGDDAGA